MRRKNITLLCLVTTCILLLCFKTTTVNADKITDADVVMVNEHKDNTELVISYVLEDKKELIIKTSEKDVVDLEALTKELGTDNVSEDKGNNEIKITIDKPDAVDFKLLINNKKVFKLEMLDADHNPIFFQTFNEDELATAETRMEGDEWIDTDGWIRSDTLRIGKGPILHHKDGSTSQPYLYFGDYEQANIGQEIIDAYSPKGKSRQNSLTAPNFGVLYAEAGSRIEDGPKAANNHIYTSHYGDNQKLDDGFEKLDLENRPYGSPNSFTSNTLYNSVRNTDDWIMPSTSGPDKNGYSFAMAGKPKLYYRINPDTGFEEQRIIYLQKSYPVDKNGRVNQKILNTITQSFDSAGKVVTKIDFTNVGDRKINNFSGFSNHDLSLNKDGREIEKIKSSRKPNSHEQAQLNKIGNFVKMRSLGSQRGMYIEDDNKEMRTSYFMNHKDGPHAWAARSIGRSYLATMGYSYTPGLLTVVPTRERYYPWKSGKPHWRSVALLGRVYFYNSDTDRYYSPSVPKYNYNAFENQHDPGDKGTKNADNPGQRLGSSEKDELWDSGLTMRTHPNELKPGRTTSLEYSAHSDINGKSSIPIIELDDPGTEDDPELVSEDNDFFKLSGSWYDFDSENVTMKYSIDNEEFKDAKVLFNKTQNKDNFGKVTEYASLTDIPLEGLNKKRTHTLRIQMNDWDDDFKTEGNKSKIKQTVFRFFPRATEEPQITVTKPVGDHNKPHNPFDHSLDLQGTWSDVDSPNIKKITYAIDDGTPQTIETDTKNPELGGHNNWAIRNIDISQHNDFKIHKIDIRIIDDQNKTGYDEFHFQHVPGSTNLIAPDEIDFGKVSISDQYGASLKPHIPAGKVLLDDFREKGSNPLSVSLSMKPFKKNITDNNNNGTDTDDGDDEDFHDSDDGDDSSSAGDPEPDRRAEVSRDRISHKTYWKKHPVKSKNLIIGQTKDDKSEAWQQTTDFTDDVLKNLQIKFKKSSKYNSTPGDYTSQWTWQIVDSMQ